MKSSISKNQDLLLGFSTLCIALVTLVVLMLPYQDMMVVKGLRVIVGSIFILFLPGYYLTRVFFRENEIDGLERFALSFALSISVVPLLMFYANLLGLPISEFSVYGIVVGVILLSGIYISFFQKQHTGVTQAENIPE